MTSLQHDDLPEIRAALAADMEGVVARLAPERPRNRRGNSLLVGNKGSLSVVMTGAKAGSWKDFETDEGGGPLDLVRHLLGGCSFPDAIDWARAFTGIGRRSDRKPRVVVPPPLPRKAIEADAKAARLTRWAQQLWRDSIPLSGTLGERYLVETRSIPRPDAGWPGVVRFHTGKGALIVGLTPDQGAVQSVQMIYLDAQGRKEGRGPGGISKHSIGRHDGAALRLPGLADGPVLFAEGPETGLSVWASTGYETIVSLGSISKLAPPAGRRIIVCQDDDKAGSPAEKKLSLTVQRWRNAGVSVAVATPWAARKGDKSDFNDAIKQGGADAVRGRIAPLVSPAGAARKRPSIEAARISLAQAIDRFFSEAEGFVKVEGGPAIVSAIRADVGTGKSDAARRRAVQMLNRMRQAITSMRKAGDNRTIVIAVPTHVLGNEQAKAFITLPDAIKAGLRAAVWRGRPAIDPDAGLDDQGCSIKMCRDLEAVADAQSVLADPEETVCKRGDATCPFYEVCGYQRQKKTKADLWIIAHEILFSQKPKAIGEVAALVVDESAWQSGLIGCQGKPTQITLEQLSGDCTVPMRGRGSEALKMAEVDTEHLGRLRALASRVLSGLSDGPLPVEAFKADEDAELFNPTEMGVARAIEYARKAEAAIKPGMTAAERKAIIAQCQQNRFIPRLAMFWRALERLFADGGPAESGHAEIITVDTDDGKTKMIRLKGIKQISDDFIVPTLLIDATLKIELVKPYWPQATLIADIEAETPHMRIFQATDKTFSKSSLIYHEKLGKKKKDECLANLNQVRSIINNVASIHSGKQVLIVAQMDVQEVLQNGFLQSNIDIQHHNNVAGRDIWRDVPVMVVIGRTQPPPIAVERIAEALTGCAIKPLPGAYPKHLVARELAGGSTVAAEVDRHPDPMAEAVRWSICEGELVQIIGRGRGVNRTQATPLDVIVLTDAVLPMPITGEFSARRRLDTPRDRMIEAGGIAYESPAHAAKAYPQLWATPDAAKKNFARSDAIPDGDNFHLSSLFGICPLLASRVEYQPAGPRRSAAVAWFDPARLSDPISALVAAQGPLAWCKIDGRAVNVGNLDEANYQAIERESVESEPKAIEPPTPPVAILPPVNADYAALLAPIGSLAASPPPLDLRWLDDPDEATCLTIGLIAWLAMKAKPPSMAKPTG